LSCRVVADVCWLPESAAPQGRVSAQPGIMLIAPLQINGKRA
jgi:hypothetical protein